MKKSVFVTVILMTLLFVCVLAGCLPTGGKVVQNPDTVYTNVSKISLSEHKTSYWLGEILDLTDVNLLVLLDNGEIKTVPVASKTVSVTGYDRFRVGTQTVTVRYGGKYTSAFEVEVVQPIIDRIALKSPPERLRYIEGARLDMSGAVITVFMQNGANVDFSVDNSIVTGYALDDDKEFTVTTGTHLELGIRYGTERIAFYVDVIPKQITAMKIASDPAKKEYYIGETPFDPEGMSIEFSYDNGKTETVAATAVSALSYRFDSSAEGEHVPVYVDYKKDGEILFTAATEVVVRDKKYASISVKKRPDGVDRLIEGYSQIDYSTGIVTVAFDNGTVEDYRMNHPSVTVGRYDNTILGKQTVYVSFLNNEFGKTSFEVTTNAKSAVGVQFAGVEDLEKVAIYEGQSARISLATLYYVLTYDNGTKGEKTPVEESMLFGGSNLTAVSDTGAGGKKTIKFKIEGVEAAIELNIIAKAAVKLELDAAPTNLFFEAGGAPDPTGGRVKVTYNNKTSEKIDLSDKRFSLSFDRTATAGASVSIEISFNGATEGSPAAYYTATVVEKGVTSVSLLSAPSKTTGYRYGSELQFEGMRLEIAFKSGATALWTAGKNAVDDGVPVVPMYDKDGVEQARIPVSVLLNGDKNVLTAKRDVYVYYYGVRADRTFSVSVDARTVNGITVASTANVPLEKFVGAAYDSVEGLAVHISYTDNSVETIVFGANTAAAVPSDYEFADPGFFWYTTGSMSEAGELVVTVVYVYLNDKGAVSTYPDSYTVDYRDAASIRVQGLFTLEGGSYVPADSLGSQPKGLTPYLQNYYLGVYYEDAVVRYVPLTVAMTDYDVKNLTVGMRAVTVRYGSHVFQTTIDVTDSDVKSVTVKERPRTNYVFTENLSLVGGLLERTFEVNGVTRRDTVEMKEAKVSYDNLWPTSVDDFNGAAKIVVTVRLSYEKVTPVTFDVDVYQPLDLVPVVVNTQNYYGNVSDPSVSFDDPLSGFSLPNYTIRYASDAEGSRYTDFGAPVLDKNGNLIYPTPKQVDSYFVVVLSGGNRYYNPLKSVEEFTVSPLAITLKPNFVSKYYLTEDPEFTYATTNDNLWREALLEQPLRSGAFTRESGDEVGEYKIVEDPDNRFAHPYFVVSVEVSGSLTVRPVTVELKLNKELLYYDKNVPDQLKAGNVDFIRNFVTVSTDGTVRRVTEYEIEQNADDPAYAVYKRYLDEFRFDGRPYRLSIAVKNSAGAYLPDLPIYAIGKYDLKVTLSQTGGKENFKLFDPDNPAIGGSDAYLSISVQAEPWAAPMLGSTTLRLTITSTDLNVLEALVAEQEAANGEVYDLVATDDYYYVWKYRPSTRADSPEGAFLAYNTTLTGAQWMTDAEGGGYKIARAHLNFDQNGAFVKLKFVANNDDRAESIEVPFYLPNIY